MEIHLLFAKISWLLLIVILFVRPLTDIFRWKFLYKILSFRKQLGIACGTAAFLHVLIYLFSIDMLGAYFSNSAFWQGDNLLGWGSFALVAMFFPLVTSNRFSQKLLKQNWKKVQRITYVTFIFVAIHVAFVKQGQLESLLIVFAWLVVWLWAWQKNKQRSFANCKN